MRKRDRRRTLAATGMACLAVLALGCGLLANPTPSDAPASRPGVTYSLTQAPSTTPPTTPKTTPPPTTASPSPTTPPSPSAARPARPRQARPLQPGRLRAARVVRDVRRDGQQGAAQRDTDWELDVVPDDGYETYLNDKNVSDNGNALVVQIMPGQHYQIPGAGEHIEIFGSWMLNINTGFNEFHPVWSITYTTTGVRQDSIPPREPLFSPSP